MQKIITFDIIANNRNITYDTFIQEQYSLTDTETKLYGIFWDNLSKNCLTQMILSNEELAIFLKKKEGTISAGVNKLKRLGFIACKIQTHRIKGGQTRYISWTTEMQLNNGLLKNQKSQNGTSSIKQRTTKKSVVAIINNKDIYNNTIKDNTNSISDSISYNKATSKKLEPLDKTEKNHSKIKMSSINKQEDRVAIKNKKTLTEEENSLFSIYNSLIKGNFNKNSVSVFEGVPRCLKLFKEIYNNKASEKFKEAINLLLSSSKWKWLIDKDPTISQPKRFFNQTFMENNLITQLDIKVEAGDKFANDPDVKLVHQHSQEALNKIL